MKKVAWVETVSRQVKVTVRENEKFQLVVSLTDVLSGHTYRTVQERYGDRVNIDVDAWSFTVEQIRNQPYLNATFMKRNGEEVNWGDDKQLVRLRWGGEVEFTFTLTLDTHMIPDLTV